MDSISKVRVGKLITMVVTAQDRQSAIDIVTRACNKILANPVIEDFSFDIQDAGDLSAPLEGAQG